MAKMVKRARRTTGMAIGAAVMYFCDPQLGAQRRQAMKDRVTSWWQGLGQARRRPATSPGTTPDVMVEVQPVSSFERVASAS